ncbi:MAG TPA: hypothetical protein ENH96_02580, partial [Chlamydiae bacterium]|nr:hypothetical protein [Chlamydiota bacterium]
WDQYLSFENRPKNIELKELDNLKQKYFYAKKVFQPGTDTIISIPAYTTGKKILNSQTLGFNHLQLNFPDKNSSLWHQEPTIFSKLHSMKINSAVVGFFHPYERIFNKHCIEKYSYFNKKIPNLFYQIISFYIAGPLNKLAFNKIKLLKTFKLFFDVTWQTHQYLGVKQTALSIIKNRDINFCFIHFSIPHPPGIYCKKTKKNSQKIRSYSENLILMDKTITEIREELQKSNLWEDSTLILTSDHWLRKHFWETTPQKLTKEEMALCGQRKEALVPLIIKMPHQKEAIAYDKPFNAISLHNLVLDIYNNKVSKEKDLVRWFDNLDDSLKKPYENITY